MLSYGRYVGGQANKVGNLCRVTKGIKVSIPMMAINRSKELWGEDALEFK